MSEIHAVIMRIRDPKDMKYPFRIGIVMLTVHENNKKSML